jgi:hypothetical protein
MSSLGAAGSVTKVAGMARTGRPKAGLTLTDQGRQTQQRWVRRSKSAQ